MMSEPAYRAYVEVDSKINVVKIQQICGLYVPVDDKNNYLKIWKGKILGGCGNFPIGKVELSDEEIMKLIPEDYFENGSRVLPLGGSLGAEQLVAESKLGFVLRYYFPN